MTFLEKYPTFRMFANELDSNAAVIIFGSYARFSADKSSDADIITISKKKMKLPSHLLPPQIHHIYMDEPSFLKSFQKKEKLMSEIMKNHIILNNHSYYVNVLWDNAKDRQTN